MNTTSNVKKSIIELNISLIIMGITTLFPKIIDLPAIFIILGRSIIASVSIFIFLKLYKADLLIQKRHIPGIIFLGILLALHWITLFESIQVSSVTIGIISFFSYHIMTVFIEPFFTKSKLTIHDIFLGILVIVGIVLVLPEFNINHHLTQGVILGLFSALFYTFRNILAKKYLRSYNGTHLMLLQVIIVSIALLPSLYFGTHLIVNNIQLNDIVKLIILGMFFTALPHCLYMSSLKFLKAKTVGIMSIIQPLYCIIFAIIFLGEIPTAKIIMGGVIILFTVLSETLRSLSQSVKTKSV
ncbi:MAG TPA: DMT family transporter [Victivallales bacterium]|nr:DMT family transporter [Victivallales bacterium]